MLHRHPILEVLIVVITVIMLSYLFRTRMYVRGDRSPVSYLIPLLIALVLTPIVWFGLLLLLGYLHEPPS